MRSPVAQPPTNVIRSRSSPRHGSAWRGDGAELLRELAKSLETKAMALPLAA
jgi:hypothetical protein